MKCWSLLETINVCASGIRSEVSRFHLASTDGSLFDHYLT